MDDKFKSDGNAADDDSQSIQTQENIGQKAETGEGITNLTVMKSIEEAVAFLNTNNSAYTNLLSKDATAITTVKEAYERLDTEISESMGLQ